MLLDKENYQGTLQKASYDDKNDKSLIENEEVEVYLLDEMAKVIENEYEMARPSSCDALYVNGSKRYVIEFKNREYKNITANDKREIRKKAYQTSELLLSGIFRNQTMKDITEHTTLFVVFKNMQDKEESFGKFVNKLNQFANGSALPIRCKLGKFKGTFYKDVYTIGKEEFENVYLPIIIAE